MSKGNFGNYSQPSQKPVNSLETEVMTDIKISSFGNFNLKDTSKGICGHFGNYYSQTSQKPVNSLETEVKETKNSFFGNFIEKKGHANATRSSREKEQPKLEVTSFR